MNSDSKSILNPQTVATIKDFRLAARLMIDGFLLGIHRGPKQAFSLEYSKHREYHPTDPLKVVDWKLHARTDRLYVKLFEEETNLQSWIFMDVSKSMTYQGTNSGLSKLDYSCRLAAALTYLLINQRDLVGLLCFDEVLKTAIPPRSSSVQLTRILKELSSPAVGGTSSFEHAARLLASRVRRKSLLILFSDLLTSPQQMEKTLKLFLNQRSELIIFHILADEELKFPFDHFSFFEDLETKQKILIEPKFLKDEYQKSMNTYLAQIREICGKGKVSYQFLTTSTPFDQGLAAFLAARERFI